MYVRLKIVLILWTVFRGSFITSFFERYVPCKFIIWTVYQNWSEILTEHMKLFMEVEAWIHAFLNLPIDGGKWSYLWFSRSTPERNSFFSLWTEGNLGRPQHNSVPFARGKNIFRYRISRHDSTTIRRVRVYIICYAKWPEGVRKPSNNDKQKAGWNYIDMSEPSGMLFVRFSETTLVATFLLLDFRENQIYDRSRAPKLEY